ncbi:hypothetical protein [Gordonia sp. (in: high G+C Gram-positive bacteria)]|uniref:hypothetical protein n=1 Tax=Gordonia sp. (in: high G+C Gram-positive bacteria) TaxID=84139 RepID=UPI00333FCEFE
MTDTAEHVTPASELSTCPACASTTDLDGHAILNGICLWDNTADCDECRACGACTCSPRSAS